MTPYVDSLDGQSISIYGFECQIWKTFTTMFTAIDPNKDISKNEANAREIATCKQNVGQKEDFMHSNFQMDISLPWIDAATSSFT
jgi:hypothetical protein